MYYMAHKCHITKFRHAHCLSSFHYSVLCLILLKKYILQTASFIAEIAVLAACHKRLVYLG